MYLIIYQVVRMIRDRKLKANSKGQNEIFTSTKFLRLDLGLD